MRCGCWGQCVTPVGFEVLKAHSVSSLISPLLCDIKDVSSEILLQFHACLPAALLPAVKVNDSYPLKL